jgi:hypothetical protein
VELLVQRDLFDGPNLIGVVGSRRRNSREDLAIVRDAVRKIWKLGDRIVSGGCPKGADWFAEIVAEELGVRDEMIIFYPDLSLMDPDKPRRFEYGRVCKLRNTSIARTSTILLALPHVDRTGGTEDTISKFERFHPTSPLLLL